MKLFFFPFFIHLLAFGHCQSHLQIGYRVVLALPISYTSSFMGRAFLMDTDHVSPNFRAALSAEASNGKYSCSLDVFLGDIKVWSSGHLSQFYTTQKCVIELTHHGDLQLKGQTDRIGWRSGTSKQGVKSLQLLRTGNLVLADYMDQIKWQSFNFPTDIMLWGQRLSLETRLTSFPNNSTFFYSFEIRCEKIALYLNSGKLKYSYWEFKPSNTRNITFIELGSKGLDLFAGKHSKIAQIESQEIQPIRFLALESNTGNLGLYFYSLDNRQFKASYQALNSTCDLPLACKPYGICTFSNACSCIRLITKEDDFNSGCREEIPEGFCGRNRVDMMELDGVTSVLRGATENVNISKTGCANLCVDDCSCVAALYSMGQCSLYSMVRGVKQVDVGVGLSYMIKVWKGGGGGRGKSSGLKKWVLILVVVVDGSIIFLVLGGIGCYLTRKKRNNLVGSGNTT